MLTGTEYERIILQYVTTYKIPIVKMGWNSTCIRAYRYGNTGVSLWTSFRKSKLVLKFYHAHGRTYKFEWPEDREEWCNIIKRMSECRNERRVIIELMETIVNYNYVDIKYNLK